MAKVRLYFVSLMLVGLVVVLAGRASAAVTCGGGDDGRCDRYNFYSVPFADLGAGGVWHRTLQCATGELAISGGIDTLTPEGASGKGFGIIDSYPNPANHRQWIFKIKNQNDVTVWYRLFIVCAHN
jgi:hypothetical protein